MALLLVAGLSATGCREDSRQAPAVVEMQRADTTTIPDSVKSEMALQLERQAVLDRVKTIYNLVKQECFYMGGSVDNDLLDKTFCSKSWNKLLLAVRSKEHNTNSLFFEVNHWTMFDDEDLVDFDEFEVKDCYVGMGNDRTATVTFTVYAAKTYTPARIDLVYEDGQWKIDNFYQLKYMMNLRTSMWRYLNNDISIYLL